MILARSSLLILVALPLAATAQAAPPVPDALEISNHVPWVRRAAPNPGSLLEQVYGDQAPAPEALPEPIRQGDMVFDHESFAREIVDQMGLPLPGVNQDPTPGVLVLAMNGVTLTPYCGTGESANGARNCTPLVDQETSFPTTAGNQSTILQTLKGYVSAFGLVVAANRPPEYLPYTLAVVGGSASNAGYGGGTCGIANVACDGLKRNHVSLTFDSCGSSLIPDIIAQETSHNWGLEHTNNTQDILYPTANGGSKSYVDACMGIVTNNNPIQCDYIHKVYCPAGNGQQQNSFQEMLGVFGPSYTDMGPPEITSITPADGSTFDSSESFTVSAQVSEDTNFVGVRWTWLEGVPENIANGAGTYTKCTNKVCDDDFGAFLDPNTTNYDFLTVGPGIPAGTYVFKFEVMDAVGGSDSQTITVTVTGEGGTSGGNTSGGNTSDGSASGTSGGDTSGGTSGGTSGDTSGLSGTSGASVGPGMDTGEDGCGCATRRATPYGLASLLLLLALRRRERRA